MIEPDFAFPYLQKQQFDIILAADRGLEFCYHYQIMPTYILGDFDSLSPEILNYYKENHVAPIREFSSPMPFSGSAQYLRNGQVFLLLLRGS
jgi:thiamine pyrophosphokinase